MPTPEDKRFNAVDESKNRDLDPQVERGLGAATKLKSPAKRASVRIEVAVRNDFLSFRLQSIETRIDMLRVREVLSTKPAEVLSCVPAFSHGLLNLRGVETPIVDLRPKLAPGETGSNRSVDIVVIDNQGEPIGAVIESDAGFLGFGANFKPSELIRKAVGMDRIRDDGLRTPLLRVFMEIVTNEDPRRL